MSIITQPPTPRIPQLICQASPNNLSSIFLNEPPQSLPFFYFLSYIMLQHWQIFSHIVFRESVTQLHVEHTPGEAIHQHAHQHLMRTACASRMKLPSLTLDHPFQVSNCQTLTFSQWFTSSSMWTFRVRRLNMYNEAAWNHMTAGQIWTFVSKSLSNSLRKSLCGNNIIHIFNPDWGATLFMQRHCPNKLCLKIFDVNLDFKRETNVFFERLTAQNEI